MRSFQCTLVALFAFSILLSTGCGSSAERIMKSNIDIMNQMAAALENDAPEATLEALGKKMEKNMERAEAMEVSEDEMDRLKKKYEEPLQKAVSRLMAASMKKAMSGAGMPDIGSLMGQ